VPLNIFMRLVKPSIVFIILFCSLSLLVQAQSTNAIPANNDLSVGTFKDCSAYLKGDSLVLENSLIKRVFRFNHGNLSTCLLVNKQSGKSWSFSGNQPDFSLPFVPDTTVDAAFKVQTITETPQHAAHLQAEIITSYKDFKVKRIFRIYPETPAVACDIYFKGSASKWSNIANGSLKEGINKVVIDHLSLAGNNWGAKSVEFFDATDHNNNLVQEYPRTIYKS
jgi:hypothetical protein